MSKTPHGFAAALPLAAVTLLSAASTAHAQDPAEMSAAEAREFAEEVADEAEQLAEDLVDRADDLADDAERMGDDLIRDAYTTIASRKHVHPITAHHYSEDALITTDLRFTYANHQFPSAVAFGGGGAYRGYDLQGRYAVNERFQVFFNKFGFADVTNYANNSNPHAADLVDLGIGVKYALIQDFADAHHFAIGAGYEFGIGQEDILAGDDELRLFAAWTKGLDKLNISASANLLLATAGEDLTPEASNTGGDSDRLSAHLHLDYRLDEIFSPVVELNYYRTLSDSDNIVTPASGIDLGNFGGNEDEDVLSAAFGGEFRYRPDLAVRLAYETPLTDNDDLFGYRWTASVVWSH